METIQYVGFTDPLSHRNYPFFLGIRENVTDSFVCHWHNNIEIMIIKKGNGNLRYGTTVFSIKDGDIFIINKNTMHLIYSTTGVDYCNIAIEDVFFRENGIAIEELTFIEKTRDPHTHDICLKFAEQYIDSLYSTDPMSKVVLRKCGLELVIELCSKYVSHKSKRNETGSTSENYVRQAMQYINENFLSSPGLDEIAQHIRISRHHLEREFKKYTNLTITHYSNIVKCKKAAVYLMNGMSVTQTATECGFNSISYFSRIFTKVMGYPPSALAHTHKNHFDIHSKNY